MKVSSVDVNTIKYHMIILTHMLHTQAHHKQQLTGIIMILTTGMMLQTSELSVIYGTVDKPVQIMRLSYTSTG